MKKFLIHALVLLTLSTPAILFAQNAVNPGSGQITIPNPAPGVGKDFISLLTALLNNVVMPIATVVVVLLIIWAGFSYLTAQGNSTKIQKAHQRLLWTLIGAGILLTAAAISLVVQNTVHNLLT